jgi:hypothetical protein
VLATKNAGNDNKSQSDNGQGTRRSMSETDRVTEAHDKPGRTEIRIKGHLDDKWADWFDGLTIRREANGDTLLTGHAIDQTALYSLLRKVRDLGMPLVAVIHVAPNQADGPAVKPPT